jgi:signal transduction histidine kinase
MATASCGLAACVVAAAAAPEPHLLEPLTLLLAATALVASLAYVDVEGTLLTDSSFVPFMLAAAFLGPAAVLGVAVSSELATWAMFRYRREAALVNLFATGGPLVIASGLLSLLADRQGPVFYVVFAGAGALELVLNAFLVVSLIGLIDGRRLAESVSGWRAIVAPFLFNLLLAIAAASVYTNLGALAVLVVLAIIVSFRYLVAQVFVARKRASRIETLADSRSKLIVQTLDAEDRERRRLADVIHDGPLQSVLSAGQDIDDLRSGDVQALQRAARALEEAVAGLRGIVFELHPALLSRGGLVAALEAIARDQATRGHFQATVHVDVDAIGLRDRLVFSIARELLVNAARHADATRVRVEVLRQNERLCVVVEDDGKGIDSTARAVAVERGHIGLASLEERVDAVGGEVRIETGRAAGTRVSAALPS